MVFHYQYKVNTGLHSFPPCHVFSEKQSTKKKSDWSVVIIHSSQHWGLSRQLSGRESFCQYRSRRFDPWVKEILWSRKWQSAPVFLPGKSHEQRRLAAYSPWAAKKSDMTWQPHHTSMPALGSCALHFGCSLLFQYPEFLNMKLLVLT